MAVFFRAYWQEGNPIEIEVKHLFIIRATINILDENKSIKVYRKTFSIADKTKRPSIVNELNHTKPLISISPKQTVLTCTFKTMEQTPINKLLNYGFIIIFGLIENTLRGVFKENSPKVNFFNNQTANSIYLETTVKIMFGRIILQLIKMLLSRRKQKWT